MESSQGIKENYLKKIDLLKELRNCLALERDNLIDLNVENIWSLMEEKQRILKSLGDVGGQIKRMEKGHRDHGILIKGRGSIKDLVQKIEDLKEEIKARVRENVSFIQESLHFFDEIISIFATGGRHNYDYGPLRGSQKELSNLIYYKEV